jgi:hypothetical protein
MEEEEEGKKNQGRLFGFKYCDGRRSGRPDLERFGTM